MENKKIITLSFMVVSIVVGYVSRILLDTLGATVSAVGRFSHETWFTHGFPVLLGAGLFFYLQFNQSILVWADDVVSEIKKVVWPSRKDTVAMTIVVCVMVIISGVILGLFDTISIVLMKYILSL